LTRVIDLPQQAPDASDGRPAMSLLRMSNDRQLLLVGGVLAAKVILLFVLALNTRFVMDEFVQFGSAKYFPVDLFRTYWPGKAVGYTVFYKAAHLIGWDARSILLAGRLQTTLLACATLAIIYATARTLGRSKLQSLLILVVVLSFSNFIERIFRTIAEPLAVFFAAAALLVAIRGFNSARWLVAAGVLCGLSFLTTQKAVYLDVALGLGLIGDAFLTRRYREVITRGALLVAGWLIAVAAYCVAFGGFEPFAILENLVFGPAAVLSPQVVEAYGGLRNFVAQTLVRNFILYLFCFSGLLIALLRIKSLNAPSRIALIFTIVITALVFTHDQPWPYVFVMCLPFLALWVLEPLDFGRANSAILPAFAMVLAVGIAGSFIRNVAYLQMHNRDQLELIDRAESMLSPRDVYFDGVSMLPNRAEPSPLWLDRVSILRTLSEKQTSEAFQIFANTPPKVILWNYRLEGVSPIILPFVNGGYVKIAPNIRVAGRFLRAGTRATFDVPVAGVYRLYDRQGRPVDGRVDVDGASFDRPFQLTRGPQTIVLRSGPAEAFLLPEGIDRENFQPGPDNPDLFAGVYS
jgi:hypothetical protein